MSKQRPPLAPLADDTSPRYPEAVRDFAVGAAVVNRDEFNAQFDVGVPLDPSSPQNDQVLILYSSEKALPSDPYAAKEAAAMTTLPTLSATDATEHCDFMNLILTDHGHRRQCMAFVGQYEAFHIQKFMRLPEEGRLDSNLPLRLVNRGANDKGGKSTKPPTLEQSQEYWEKHLVPYIQSLPTVLEELRPIAEQAAVDNTLIVLVCNQGQSELLVNFLCACRKRNLDTSGILIFATDEETRDLVQAMGVPVFYDSANTDRMPKQAAKRYADKTFMAMMMAKVYCVQMSMMLGYNVLFQDVDVIWYKNPLEYFKEDKTDFDMFFQDDGNHGLYYAPYSANTGFYYIRNNQKTQYFFNAFLMSGDLILGTRSHQVPLVALLQEHASMYGLRVKIFGRDGSDFPGGHAFHRRKDFMKDLFAGVHYPYIFHMSWTLNKDNKIKYYQQMGEWMLEDKCVQKTVHEILGDAAPSTLASACCAAEPLVTCHYRDKPSIKPCRDSPPIDKGRPSWW